MRGNRASRFPRLFKRGPFPREKTERPEGADNMKKNGRITAAAVFTLALLCLGTLIFFICASADGETPVTSPINITFDTSKWFVSTRISGATASKMAMYADITNYVEYGSADGWYVDNAPLYTCIVLRDPAIDDPSEWPMLNDSEELLKADGDYYYRIEIEDAEGFDWEAGNIPPVTVNGKAPDFSTAGKAESSGYFDVFVKAVFDEVSDQVVEIKFAFYDTFVQRGTSKQLDYTVYGTVHDVTWTLEAHSSGTSITPGGVITIGSDETSYVYATATSAVNPKVTANCRIRVTDDPVNIESIKVTPTDSEIAYPGLVVYFDAEVVGNDADYVTWSIVSGPESGNTTLLSNGELKVAYDETAESITVRATSLVEPDKFGEFTIPVGKIQKITGPIEITFNLSALKLSLETTGREVTERIALPETAFTQFGIDNAKNGWYVDSGTSYTCLVEQAFGEEFDDPKDWPTLGDSDDKLSSDKVYYLRIEIEDCRRQGFEWDAKNPPVFTVNGVEPDIVMPSGSDEAYADLFIRLDIPGSPSKTLTDLKLEGEPKALYTDGDYFYLSEYKLKAVYDDGTELDLTGYGDMIESSVKNSTKLTPDVTEIVFSYREGGVTKSVTLPIKVLAYLTVTLDPLNGDSPTVRDEKEGNTLPDWIYFTPSKSFLAFDGWYFKNSSGEEVPFDFNAPVEADVYVYAKYKALAEAHVQSPGSGTVKSVGAIEDGEGENVYAYWPESADGLGSFVAVPAEGYRFVEWRFESSSGNVIKTLEELPDQLYYTKTANGDLYFRTLRGGYRFYAIFEKAEVLLESITIERYPDKVVYNEGDVFDSTGISVSALFSDGTFMDVTGEVTFEPAGALTPADKTVTVSFTDAGITKTATLEISVNAKTETATPGESENPGDPTGAPTDGPEATPEPAGDKNVEIVTETLPDAVKGKNYSAIIEVKGEEPVTLTLTGVLPEGLKFNSSNGEIYGTPEKTGTYSFIIKAETASGTVEKALALNVVKKSSVGKVFGIIGIVLGSAAVLAGGAALALFLIKKKHA